MQRTANHYRLPERLTGSSIHEGPPAGYFTWGEGDACLGTCSETEVTPSLPNQRQDVQSRPTHDDSFDLPFDPDRLIENLLLERYATNGSSPWPAAFLSTLYYQTRPLLPATLRSRLQRLYLADWPKIRFPRWPVDVSVESLREKCLHVLMQRHGLDTLPFIWFWPDGQDAAAIVTHDVETETGRDFCSTLMDIDASYGVKSAFQIVPEERYAIPEGFLSGIRGRGFEINVHDLNHDGRLFSSQETFMQRVAAINRYGKIFDTRGFRSGVLYRNHNWSHALDFDFDMSVPNVAHLEPQRGGCCTVFPYFVGSLLELPSTTTQDYALFRLLRDYSLNLWKEQVAIIRQKHGLISILVHPDYILETKERELYLQLLRYLQSLRAEHNVWIATPREVNAWWRTRSQLTVVSNNSGWQIIGRGKERARLAYARLDGSRIRYEIASSAPGPPAPSAKSDATEK